MSMKLLQKEDPRFNDQKRRIIQQLSMIRIKRGISSAQMARDLKVDYSNLVAVENGRVNGSSRLLYKIADYLGFRAELVIRPRVVTPTTEE